VSQFFLNINKDIPLHDNQIELKNDKDCGHKKYNIECDFTNDSSVGECISKFERRQEQKYYVSLFSWEERKQNKRPCVQRLNKSKLALARIVGFFQENFKNRRSSASSNETQMAKNVV
jgi:hypothetical protein